MATRQHATTNLVGNVIRVTWTGLTKTTDDDGSALVAPDHAFKDAQVLGTFGAGGTVVLEGSLDGGTTWATLNDVQGNALSFAAARIERVQETGATIRPRVTAGDGTTALTVVLLLKMPNAADS